MKPITIRLTPEMADELGFASAYDEAKRACEQREKLPMTLDDETRPIWEAAQRAAAEVAAWPAWKHNKLPRDEDCCVGDVSRCRCAVGQPVAKRDEEEQQWQEVWTETEDA